MTWIEELEEFILLIIFPHKTIKSIVFSTVSSFCTIILKTKSKMILSLYKLLCFVLLFSFLSPFFYCVLSSCADLHYCSGHGKCTNDDICLCEDGWGSASDLSLYKSPDCSTRVCPSGIAWADLPTAKGLAHNLAECSNGGLCNRKTGKCECFQNFAGEACQRSKCPNDCSGHGVCKSMRRIAQEYSVNTTIYGSGLELLFEDNIRLVSSSSSLFFLAFHKEILEHDCLGCRFHLRLCL